MHSWGELYIPRTEVSWGNNMCFVVAVPVGESGKWGNGLSGRGVWGLVRDEVAQDDVNWKGFQSKLSDACFNVRLKGGGGGDAPRDCIRE